MTDIPFELRQAYDEGNLIVVVGSQLSVDAGLPRTDELATQLLELAVENGLHLDPDQLREMIGHGRTADALSLLERRFGPEFQRRVERALSDQGRVVPELASAIAELSGRLRAVYTTNLDRLLERAFKDEWPSFASPRADLAQRRALIFKLRGTLEFAQSWVLTSEQQAREFSSRSLRQAVFHAVYNAHRLLFLGFTPESEVLAALLDMVDAAVGYEEGPSHFIVLEDCALEQRERLEGRGLEVLRADPKDVLLELGGGSAASRSMDLGQQVAGLEGSPYPGLEPFTDEQTKLFFGRQAEISQAVSRLGASGSDHRRWLSIEGPSGVGKSSFARAGVVRAIRHGFGVGMPARWRIATLRPGKRPMSALVRALARALGVDGPEDLRDEGALREMLRQTSAGVLVVVDQLEELVGLAEDDEREQFARVLAESLEHGLLYLVTTLRSDFVPGFQQLAPALAGLLNEKAERYALPPISRVGLREAIVAPAQLCGVEVEAELVDQLIFDTELLANPDAGAEQGGKALTRTSTLPLVAHVLRHMWDLGSASEKVLRLSDYEVLGGIAGALTRSANATLDQLDAGEREKAKQLLLAMVRVDSSGAGETRRALTREAAVALAGEAVVTKLSGSQDTGARVLVVTVDGEQAWVELVHETLLREWDTLVRWIDADRGQLVLDAELEHQAARWHERGRPRRGLPRGPELAALMQGRPRGAGESVQREFQTALRRVNLLRRGTLAGVAGGIALIASGIAWGFARKNDEIQAQKDVVEAKNVELVQEKQAQQDALSTQRSVMAQMLIPQNREGEALRLATQAVGVYGPDWSRAAPAEAVAGLERVLAEDALHVSEAASCVAHTGAIRYVAWAPDGASLATASEDGSALVWNPQSCAPLATLTGHGDKVYRLAYAPDSSRIATASLDKTAKIWSAQSGELLETLEGHEGGVLCVDFSPDGAHVLTGSTDRSARIWDAQTGTSTLTLADDGVVGVALYSPDGARVATCGKAQTAKIWDAQTGARLATLTGHRDGSYIVNLAFSPDGARIATAGIDKTGRIWDASSGELLLTLEGHLEPLMSVAYSPDGARVATSGTDKTAKLWDAQTGELLATLSGNSYSVVAVAFAPDGAQLATVSSDGSAQLWDADGRQLAALVGHRDALYDLAYAPDGEHLATASNDNTARVWSTDIDNPIANHRGHQNVVFALTWSPDGKRVATGSKDKTARIWNAETGEQLAVLEGHGHTIGRIGWSPDGARLATASYDKTTRLWDPASGELITTLEDQQSPPAMAWSADGELLATASRDKSVRLWDGSSGAPRLEPLAGHQGTVAHLRFSPDGARLVTASADKTARSWDPKTGKQLALFSGHEAGISAIEHSPAAARLATAANDGRVRIWDAETGKQLQLLAAGTGAVGGLAYSPDGAQLAAASEDGKIYVWTAETGELLHTLSAGDQPVGVLTFTGDGAHLVTGATDGLVRVWSTTDGTLLNTIEAHHGAITAMMPSPDRAQIATASMDNSARVWDPLTGELRASLADHIGLRQDDGSVSWPIAPAELTRIACERLRSSFGDEFAKIAETCESL